MRLEHQGSIPKGNPSTRTDKLHDFSELRASEEKHRSLVANLNDIVCTADASGNITYISHQVESIAGYKPSELIGGPFLRLVHPEDLAGALEVWQGCREGKVGTTECRVLVKNGRYRFARQSFRPQFEDGQFVGATAILTDVTEQHEAESALREREEEFRTLFELSRDAIALVRPDGTFVDVNQAWLDLFGFSREELPGITAYTVHENPAERDAVFLKELRETGGITDAERRFRKKDGTVMDCLCNIVARRDETGAITAIQSSTWDITESKRARRELQESRDNLNELHAYLVNSRESERAAIARELHDQTSQALNALRLDLSDVRQRLVRGESIGPASLDRMVELVDNISGDVRRLSSNLRPGVLDDLGLSAAIEWNVQEFASWTGLRASLHLSADDSSIAPDCATTLFRVLRELLSNVVRHARASALSVSLFNRGESLVLTVTDDGHGITDEELASKESLGIISIRERVNLFGGSVVIRGESGKGTTAEVTIPTQPRLPE